MASRRAILRMTFLVVALVLILFIGFSMIGASLSPSMGRNTSPQEQQIAELNRQLDLLRQQIQEISENREYILILRIDFQCLGGRCTIFSQLLQISVEKEFFDSIQIGDDITDSDRVHPIGNSGFLQARITVDGKFTDTP